MNKNIILFQLILCLTSFQGSYAMDECINPVLIERCPSVSKSDEFCKEVEQQVGDAEKKSSVKPVVIRFEAPLVPLLRKLDSQRLLKVLWQQRLYALFQKLASNDHRVAGLYCAYQEMEDLKFVAFMLEPLVQSKKLQQCRLTQLPCCTTLVTES